MIPVMNASSVLPPYLGEEPGERALMSPYDTSMLEVVQRFGTSLERVAILRGLLSYRQAMRSVGVVDGHQWLDGSFVEDVEAIRNRPPADIDIVTFARVPGDNNTKLKTAIANPALFVPQRAKAEYKCDAYFVDLDKKAEFLVDDTRYWFGLFSHQRETSLWKGMLKVTMQSDDIGALAVLDQIERELGGLQNA
jgi:hypothetical protein